MVQSALEIKDISKGFGPIWAREEIISKFSLSVQAGKLTVLVGPSGCGKATSRTGASNDKRTADDDHG